jgi:hypothetical protein
MRPEEDEVLHITADIVLGSLAATGESACVGKQISLFMISIDEGRRTCSGRNRDTLPGNRDTEHAHEMYVPRYLSYELTAYTLSVT